MTNIQVPPCILFLWKNAQSTVQTKCHINTFHRRGYLCFLLVAGLSCQILKKQDLMVLAVSNLYNETQIAKISPNDHHSSPKEGNKFCKTKPRLKFRQICIWECHQTLCDKPSVSAGPPLVQLYTGNAIQNLKY